MHDDDIETKRMPPNYFGIYTTDAGRNISNSVFFALRRMGNRWCGAAAENILYRSQQLIRKIWKDWLTLILLMTKTTYWLRKESRLQTSIQPKFQLFIKNAFHPLSRSRIRAACFLKSNDGWTWSQINFNWMKTMTDEKLKINICEIYEWFVWCREKTVSLASASDRVVRSRSIYRIKIVSFQNILNNNNHNEQRNAA